MSRGNGVNGDRETGRVASGHSVRLLIHLDHHTLDPADLPEGVDDLGSQQAALRIRQRQHRVTERYLGDAVSDRHRIHAQAGVRRDRAGDGGLQPF